MTSLCILLFNFLPSCAAHNPLSFCPLPFFFFFIPRSLSLFLAPFCLLTNCWLASLFFILFSLPLFPFRWLCVRFIFSLHRAQANPTKELKSFPFLFSNKLKQPRRKIAKRSVPPSRTHKTKQTVRLCERAESNLFVRQLRLLC